METIFALIEGAFGALIMVVSGMGAIITMPIAIALILIPLTMGEKKGKAYYLKCLSLPVVCFAIACGTFILRAFVATFFGPSEIAQAATQLFIG